MNKDTDNNEINLCDLIKNIKGIVIVDDVRTITPDDMEEIRKMVDEGANN